MVTKINNNRIEDVDNLSQLDYGGVIKDVHSFPGHYLRVRDALTVVKQHYDYLTATYSGNLPTQVKYYVGLSPHETRIQCLSDTAGSLNNKYFFVYEGRSNRKFHVWYNVNGAGTDPAPPNSTGIEVAISTGDAAGIVSYASELVINSTLFREYFTAKRAGAMLYITANKAGVTSDSLDVDTGFTLLNQQGVSQLVQTVDIEYDGADPLFESQVLKGYYYDIYSGSYRKNVDVPSATADNATVATIANVAVTLANTEYSYTFPTGTKNFLLRDRDADSKLRIAYALGDTGTTYFTNYPGNIYTSDNLATTSGFTIYFRSNKANRVIEILSWK
jgi:hypothetical protein